MPAPSPKNGPGVNSLQWVDANSIVGFDYPARLVKSALAARELGLRPKKSLM